jgi:hypothetical protein
VGSGEGVSRAEMQEGWHFRSTPLAVSCRLAGGAAAVGRTVKGCNYFCSSGERMPHDLLPCQCPSKHPIHISSSHQARLENSKEGYHQWGEREGIKP